MKAPTETAALSPSLRAPAVLDAPAARRVGFKAPRRAGPGTPAVLTPREFSVRRLVWLAAIGLTIASLAHELPAQTVSGVSPVISPAQSYTVSSSPLSSGRRVHVVQDAPASRRVYVSGADREMRTAASREQRGTAGAGAVQNAGWTSGGQWQREVVTTMYQMPEGQAPDLRSPPSQPRRQAASRQAANGGEYYARQPQASAPRGIQSGRSVRVAAQASESSSAQPPAGYYSPQTSYQQGPPAASQQPSLPSGNGMPTQSAPPQAMPGQPTTPPGNLNWQNSSTTTTVPATRVPAVRYSAQGVCTPINTYYPNNPCAPMAIPRSSYRPVVPRSMPGGAYLGQGVLGQPKAYVDGQPVRNFFRYLLP